MTFEFLSQLASAYPFVLGSASPRRFRLLEETGITFTRAIADIDESRLPGEDPFGYALRLAETKALAVAESVSNRSIVLGGDTIVVLGDDILSKPDNPEEAQETLRTLSGKEHVVCTALSLARRNETLRTDAEETVVRFNTVTDRQIIDYVATGEPMDKAGAYGIQGMGAFLVDSIDGNLDTVIGLPRFLLDRLARETLHLLKRVID